MPRATRRLAVQAGALLVAAMLTGCGGPAPQAPATTAGVFHAEFEQARRLTTEPTILAILADETITDAELRQAQELTLQCLNDLGYSARFDDEGSLAIDWPADARPGEVDEAQQECALPRIDAIKWLYSEMRYNPTNTPRIELTLDCLKRLGLVDATATADEIETAIASGDVPWDPVSGDAQGCQEDPLGYQGGNPDLIAPPIPMGPGAE